MLPATIFLWMLAAGLGVLAYTRPGELHRTGAALAWKHSLQILPRVVMAVMTAGFLGELLPEDMIAAWLGDESGMQGVLIASVIGGFVPGGPVLSFPIAAALMKTGAGWPQLTAFLVAWSVFAIHRVIAFEIPLMGWRFSLLRFLSSLVLPPLAGLLVGFLMVGAGP